MPKSVNAISPPVVGAVDPDHAFLGLHFNSYKPRSAALLERQTRPSSKKSVKAGERLRM